MLVAAVVAAAACSGSTTQYVGTVRSEANPEVESSIRLTLHAASDTSFGGVVDIGLPAHGTGSAYAWIDGTGLQMITVGAESGDTIRWISRLTDNGLGGPFEIIGGERAGQEGTWRARLVAGPPATVATLRARGGVPSPRPTALWPIALLLGVGYLLGRWILRATRTVPVAGGPLGAFAARHSGIGGWLALFVLGRAVAVVVTLVHVRTAWGSYLTSIDLGAAVTGMQPMIVLETCVAFLLFPLNVLGLVLLLRRTVYAPRYWFALLVITAVFLLTDHVSVLYLHPQVVHLVGAGAFADTPAGDQASAIVRDLLFSVIWALYWAQSLRVRATFGTAALDRLPPAPVPLAASSSA
jgi:hypothetical protein